MHAGGGNKDNNATTTLQTNTSQDNGFILNLSYIIHYVLLNFYYIEHIYYVYPYHGYVIPIEDVS